MSREILERIHQEMYPRIRVDAHQEDHHLARAILIGHGIAIHGKNDKPADLVRLAMNLDSFNQARDKIGQFASGGGQPGGPDPSPSMGGSKKSKSMGGKSLKNKLSASYNKMSPAEKQAHRESENRIAAHAEKIHQQNIAGYKARGNAKPHVVEVHEGGHATAHHFNTKAEAHEFGMAQRAAGKQAFSHEKDSPFRATKDKPDMSPAGEAEHQAKMNKLVAAHDERIQNAETMYGTGSKQHEQAKEQFQTPADKLAGQRAAVKAAGEANPHIKALREREAKEATESEARRKAMFEKAKAAGPDNHESRAAKETKNLEAAVEKTRAIHEQVAQQHAVTKQAQTASSSAVKAQEAIAAGNPQAARRALRKAEAALNAAAAEGVDVHAIREQVKQLRTKTKTAKAAAP